MKTLSLILAVLGFAASLVCAQSPSPTPLPPDTLLIHRRAPALACWEVTFEGKAGPSSGPALRGVRITKTGDVIHEQFLFDSGQAGECWMVGATQMVRLSGDPAIKMDLYGKGLPITPYALISTDFPGFEWVSRQTYAGTKKVGDRVYYVFQKNGTRMEMDGADILRAFAELDGGGSSPAGPLLAVVAIVDAQTHLPVALHVGEELRRYQFLEPPKAQQTLPGEFGTMYHKALARLQECSKPISPP
jgi:hypothetical protein